MTTGDIIQSVPDAGHPQVSDEAAGANVPPTLPSADPIHATELQAAIDRAALPISVRFVADDLPYFLITCGAARWLAHDPDLARRIYLGLVALRLRNFSPCALAATGTSAVGAT